MSQTVHKLVHAIQPHDWFPTACGIRDTGDGRFKGKLSEAWGDVTCKKCQRKKVNKVLRAPREPKTFNHPRLYLVSEVNGSFERMRIVHPSGYVEFLSEHSWGWLESTFTRKDGISAVYAMREDGLLLDRKVTFIGEIK